MTLAKVTSVIHDAVTSGSRRVTGSRSSVAGPWRTSAITFLFGKEGLVMHEQVQAETFARHPSEVPAARRFVRGALTGHPAAADAELLTCELVTNALLHAADAAKVTVTVILRGAIVHAEVSDDGRSGVPHWREIPADAEGGRGFHLVNEIAARWGFLRDENRSCCWFDLGSEGSQ
jgi:anti-sigma regulatory factor (Ser/Thr protein kinase)